ncbi:MAG: CO dehydrogenase/CO-methylating acetyl-CoA synthase complex subunit beta [archaeon GB-1867-035]|nr:CO dehydrogenase/CO-methylating acetyl-CoA synthase complex subunit beta [Candidatus Culexmicrobium profundum]
MSAFEGFPIEISPAFEGQRVRRKDMYVELGGPKIDYKFELVRVKPMDEVEDGKVEIIGPDLMDLKEGGSYPFAILIYVAGEKLDTDLEGVIERRIHMYTNYIEGIMHLNQRYDIWIRIAKKSVKKGLNSFSWWGRALITLFKSEMPYIEKMQVTFITDPELIKEKYEEALKIYEERDARVRGLKDEEVDMFYGCVLCQSFAPTHVCVITPERISLCGALTWLDARAAANIDPKGPNFPIPKGELLDPIKGEWSGANEVVAKRSLGEVTRVYLYSMFEYPHTSCGCFEAIAFYIPEVDGIGIVHRGFKGTAVNGLPFSTMAAQTGGGQQSEGFLGIGIEWMRSRKFFYADGGWNRIVWMPKDLKERVKDAIPPELYDKIATEEDATTIEDLKNFLLEKDHPVASKIREMEKAAEAEAKAEKVEEVAVQQPVQMPTMPQWTPQIPAQAIQMPAVSAQTGFKITLKGVKIKINRLIIKKAGGK